MFSTEANCMQFLHDMKILGYLTGGWWREYGFLTAFNVEPTGASWLRVLVIYEMNWPFSDSPRSSSLSSWNNDNYWRLEVLHQLWSTWWICSYGCQPLRRYCQPFYWSTYQPDRRDVDTCYLQSFTTRRKKDGWLPEEKPIWVHVVKTEWTHRIWSRSSPR